jgi:hypothetical protein
MKSLRVSHGRPGPSFKTWFTTTGYSEVNARKICRVWCPSGLCASSISIHPFQMSGSSENDSSHRSGGESDHEGSAASSHESELPDSHKRRRNIQIQGRAYVLRGEITTDLLLNNVSKTSMDDVSDDDAKVQNTKSQTEAALGPKFENLFQRMHTNVKYCVLFGNLVNILHAEPAATQVKIQIQGYLQVEKTTRLTALKNYCPLPCLRLFPESGRDAKTACVETRSTRLAGLRILCGFQSRLRATSALTKKAGQQTRACEQR